MKSRLILPRRTETAYEPLELHKIVTFHETRDSFIGTLVRCDGLQIAAVGMTMAALDEGRRFGPMLPRAYRAFSKRVRDAWWDDTVAEEDLDGFPYSDVS